jgi:hypothetical protein
MLQYYRNWFVFFLTAFRQVDKMIGVFFNNF